MASALYDERFYSRQRDGSRSSARAILPLIVGWTRPASAVDVGCGVGTWLAALRDLGVRDVVGIDGDHVDRARLEMPPDRLLVRDLDEPFTVDREFDLAICLEVAEHLPASRADGFVESLSRLAPVLLFSAAIPGQGGTGHVNEAWPAAWARRFATRGFVALDPVRRLVWDDPAVEPWYAQNALVFVRRDALGRHPELEAAGRLAGDPPSLVHPEIWTKRAVSPSLHRAWRDFRRALGCALARPFRRRRRADSDGP